MATPMLHSSPFAEYDQVRHQRLLGVVLPIVIAIVGIGALYYSARMLLNPTYQTLASLFNDMVFIALLIGFSFSFAALRRGTMLTANALLASSGIIGLSAITVIHAFFEGLDSVGYLVFGVVIALGSLFGNTRLLVMITLLVNALTALCLLVAAPLHPILLHTGTPVGLALGLGVLFEWMITAFLIAQRSTYQQMIQAVGDVYEQAQQLDELKDQFIAHVNHELRNPIMTLRGTVEYVVLARDQLSPQEQDDLMRKALRTGDGLMHMLDSILDVRAIESSNNLMLQDVHVRQALDEALLFVNPQDGSLSLRDLQIGISADLIVYADPIRLQQILTNLVSNALKYTPVSSPIVITAAAVTVEKGKQALPFAEIEIRDFGPGIPTEQIPLLFRRFVRLERDLGSSVTGNGLGLYLCRLFAEGMGGSIWVESTGIDGEGSTFHLQLPIVATAVAMTKPAPSPSSSIAQRLGRIAGTQPKRLATNPAIALKPEDYVIPNDLRESQRLDFQHFIIREAFQGNHLALLDQPKHILDVATGTGRWAIEIAREFPEAEVIGTDLVAPTAAYVEADLPTPTNYQFQLSNLLEGLPFADNTFDYVHLRFIGVALPMEKWPETVRELARVTAPEGWIELMEAMPMESGGPAIDQLLDVLVSISKARGMSPLKESQLGEWLSAARLTNVTARTERLPFGTTRGRLGHYLALDIFTGIRGVGAGLAKAGLVDAATFDTLVQQADAEVHSGQYECVVPVYIAYGQKPS